MVMKKKLERQRSSNDQITSGRRKITFSRAAKKKTRPPINPMKIPRGGRKKRNRMGVTRWFAFRELAVLAAISNGVNYAWAITRIYDTDQPSMVRASEELYKGKLITKKRMERKLLHGKKRMIVEFELTESGKIMVEMMKRYDEFISFDKWVKYQKDNEESGSCSVEGIQKTPNK